MNIADFYKKKTKKQKISMITCYDYSSAKILSQTAVDCLLVGDSVAMTMHGHKDTISATLEMMALHTAAVRRGSGNKFIVSDLPFLSYRKSCGETVSAVQTLLQAGAHAVKLEGAQGNQAVIQHLVESGVPVMGHLGLTPQFVNALGGYKVQGRTEASATRIMAEAKLLQEWGCFALVLECVPSQLASDISAALTIPTIGIGAGPCTDGQVLVFQDLLGFNIDFKPSFVKTFLDGQAQVKLGVANYIRAINEGEFPLEEHCF